MKAIEVLIVEDNIKISRTHQAFVEKMKGFEVTGVANTIDDANLLLGTLKPHLILLDIYFPEGSGMAFLKKVRAEEYPVDVILITAAKEVEMLNNALHGGAFDYMIKPVFFDRFEESLNAFRTHFDQLHQQSDMTQEDANRFFRGANRAPEQGDEMPKGIDRVTLESVIAEFKEINMVISAEEMGKRLGVSRTTARKYMEYLISTGFLQIQLDYGTKGRPERKYSRNQ